MFILYLEKKKDDKISKNNVWEGNVTSNPIPSEDHSSATPKSSNVSEPTSSSKKKWDGSFGKCAMDDL